MAALFGDDFIVVRDAARRRFDLPVDATVCRVKVLEHAVYSILCVHLRAVWRCYVHAALVSLTTPVALPT